MTRLRSFYRIGLGVWWIGIFWMLCFPYATAQIPQLPIEAQEEFKKIIVTKDGIIAQKDKEISEKDEKIHSLLAQLEWDKKTQQKCDLEKTKLKGDLAECNGKHHICPEPKPCPTREKPITCPLPKPCPECVKPIVCPVPRLCPKCEKPKACQQPKPCPVLLKIKSPHNIYPHPQKGKPINPPSTYPPAPILRDPQPTPLNVFRNQ